MTGADSLGVWAGLALGLGLVLLHAHVRARRVTFEQRLSPYVPRPDLGTGTDEGALPQFRGFLGGMLGAPLRRATHATVRILGGSDELARRLRRAGDARSVEQVRASQVVGLCVGLALGLVVAVPAGAAGAFPVPVAIVLVLLLGLSGAILPDVRLGTAIKQREEAMLLEFPTIAEVLALAVAAGESPHAALQRVARIADGELVGEMRHALADIHAGANLSDALDRLADRTGVPALGRFAEGIAVAVERGTPVAEVLRAQAQDVREDGHRRLMEIGGRKEVAMLVPVVFLVLPITIFFALYPTAVVLVSGL
ncbi:type II secretion system F family protein [Flavimobilis sp. GY10621]|uniref:Type II secretion system F family protein n=1 Tax=Flavimobilis rhizosphaerae TaxID=2775421 RepID=A0ABR9DSV6_9MICO|nr:type II secretion system F family protein [Flavimobilis rhizosphaerae]MBD9699055.1 type II secretion system F family protein [Flavimobilis rhizosphaerae]